MYGNVDELHARNLPIDDDHQDIQMSLTKFQKIFCSCENEIGIVFYSKH